jgi:hypothetical protein
MPALDAGNFFLGALKMMAGSRPAMMMNMGVAYASGRFSLM